MDPRELEHFKKIELPYRDYTPIVCCDCGKIFSNASFYNARCAGWEGFSMNIDVKYRDGFKKEHLGKCPDCQNG